MTSTLKLLCLPVVLALALAACTSPNTTEGNSEGADGVQTSGLQADLNHQSPRTSTGILSTSASKGSLFILGGGERPDSLMRRMLDLAGASHGHYIAVLTMASSEPQAAYEQTASQLNSLGPLPCVHFNLTLADMVNPARLDSVRNAAVVYITGGDQSRFMEVAGGTPIGQAIQDAFASGAVVGGSSAGAAIMSDVMITGDQQFSADYAPTYDKIWAENAVYAQGLGLLRGAVIDQHFVARSRYNRLLSAQADHPGLFGLGIDESTALLVRAGRAEVCGASQVVVFYPARERSQRFHHVGLKGMQVDVLLAGDSFPVSQP